MITELKNPPFLEVENLYVYFGGLCALNNINFKVYEGELVGLIGPNGSGKSTLFNCISGFIKPTKGTIRLMSKDIKKLSPDKRTKAGVARTFQIPRPFLKMSVLKNVMVALCFGGNPLDLKASRQEAKRILDILGLSHKEESIAEELTLIERRKLELARALALQPKLLLLDEPMAGLNDVEIEEASEIIKKLKEEKPNLTIIWIEHNLRCIIKIAERILVLSSGELIADGKPHEITHDAKVIEAYLGEGYA